ncbi:PREDICTED: ataxin-7-like protein 1 isoform X2 [Nicrophorus vespilloides]|uniref:Ataxin-7-like protein 1 isoform X2 n=1 Tax=Nicrophorus vespilloides TaxID=110193 RepID=A0ABM1NGW9_NICVS|nr:PREDICTED: ataxin-7-like protein 1 isoform X2 [Nicrophorus vespilloides]
MSTSGIPELLQYSGKSWKEWTPLVTKNISITTKPSALEYKTIPLLPRRDFPLYGEFPKLDNKVLIECEKCGTVLLPCVYPKHCNNPNHDKLIVQANQVQTKGSSTSKSGRPNFIPPGTSLLKKKYQPAKNKKRTGLPPSVPPPPLFAKAATTPPTRIPAAEPLIPPIIVAKPVSPKSSSSHTAPSSSSSKHKRSKKSGRKTKEDEKIDKTAKSTAELKSAKVNHTNHWQSSKSKEYKLVIDLQATVNRKETSIQSILKLAPSPHQSASNIKVDILKPSTAAISPLTATKPQRNAVPPTVLHMPMSPTTPGVRNVPPKLPVLRLAKEGGDAAAKPQQRKCYAYGQEVFDEEFFNNQDKRRSAAFVKKIPSFGDRTPVYTSHPKPLSMITRTARKVGTTFMLHHKHLYHQRNEILGIARQNLPDSPTSQLPNQPSKSGAQKNTSNKSQSSTVKVSVKRSPSERLTNESKHIRLNDVNGYILHADVSESSESATTSTSQLHNNAVVIHDQVTIVNMK